MGVHKDEISPDPDWQRMAALEAAGILKAWTARDGDTLDLVGYLAWYVMPHIDSRTVLTAECGAYYLAKDYRRGLNGLNMIGESIKRLQAMGVKRAVMHSRLGLLDPIFRRLGFEPLDQTWDRML
jgi:hypothetical protein